MAIKWGIIGCGRIASKFANDISLVDNNELYAVASRNINKANDFADKFGVQKRYGDYESICKDDDVDIIYLATPHSHHMSVGLLVLNNRKNLLCEKPLGVNASQVNQLVEAAQQNNVFLMEALWSRFNPAINDAFQKISNGDIGEVVYVNADFYFTIDYDVKHRLFNPDLAGGALLDIGIYPIFLSYLFLGMPSSILSKSRLVDQGVDLQTSVILDYPNAQSILSFGLQTKSDMRGCINGTKGSIQLLDRWHETTSYELLINGERERFDFPRQGYGYTFEIFECEKCITEGRIESNFWTHQDSINLIHICDEIRNQNNAIYPIE